MSEEDKEDLKHIFAKDTSGKGLFSNTYKEPKTLNKLFKEWSKELSRHISLRRHTDVE